MVAFHDIKPREKSGRSNGTGEDTSAHIILAEGSTGARSKQTIQIAILIGVGLFILLVIKTISLISQGAAIEKNIKDQVKNAFTQVAAGASALRQKKFQTAQDDFVQAQGLFKNIKSETWFTQGDLPGISLKNPIFESLDALLKTGTYLATAGEQFSLVSEKIAPLPKLFFEGNKNPDQLNRPSLTEKLRIEVPALLTAAESLQKAQNEAGKISETFVPAQLRDQFSFAKEALGWLTDNLKTIQEDSGAILTLLGDQKPHTILVLLQNNTELRPTGGFIGNYMILQLTNGYLTKQNVVDVYQSDHQLQELILPPAEIAAVNTRWFLRDSNYSIDFPHSAEKAAWFLKKEGGPTVDTVIALDQTVISELLKLTGPISVNGLSQPLQSDNAFQILSYIIEAKLSGREDPKALLRNFTASLLPAITAKTEPLALLPLIQDSIQKKHLLAYSADKNVEGFWERHGLAGEIKKLGPKEDFLAIAHTSIGGNKSDLFMKEYIEHDTYLNRDGSLTDEIKLTRTHGWNAAVENRFQTLAAYFGLPPASDEVLQILGRSRNLHMLRIYVPKGAVLESADAPLLENKKQNTVETKLDPELDTTYFSTQMMVPVGESRTLRIRYKLPFQLTIDPVDEYKLTIQKQPGQENVTFSKKILPESDIKNYASFPPEAALDSDGLWNYETDLNRDISVRSVWGN